MPVVGGAIEIEGKAFTVEPFHIAKYPITYMQFQAFIDARGFHNPAWWEGLSASYDPGHWSEPDEQERPFDNHPRENVSWYDAVAFCRWLNAHLGLPQLPTDLTVNSLATYEGIRLPTEWEWLWAAQGGEGREYPWGNEWDCAKANTDESGLSRTTAVGMYPAGEARCGALDMSGNVEEWCLNKWGTLENVGLGGMESRSACGGSWGFNQYAARVGERGDLGDPHDRLLLTGFRVAMLRPSMKH
jgi:formylglycine-generating enzyme required for sulfatase activity